MGRRRNLLRRRFEVEDIEGECRLFEITLLECLRQARHEREQRTRSDELQERATIGHAGIIGELPCPSLPTNAQVATAIRVTFVSRNWHPVVKTREPGTET